MLKQITLVLFNETTNINWSFGNKIALDYTTKCLIENKDLILSKEADFILFWDANNVIPTKEELLKTYNSKGNLWHVGSKIGLKNMPILLDAIQPTSMLHVSIDNSINHSSWKNTFKGCLLEKRVFEEIPIAEYSNSLDIIGLDFGCKAIKAGVFTRYSFKLASKIKQKSVKLKKQDELLFIKNNFDKKAFIWTYLTNVLSISPIKFLRALKSKRVNFEKVFVQKINKDFVKENDISVSAVIATLERYSVLTEELKELRLLDPPLNEIIIVDQTPKDIRNNSFLKLFKDLPIVYIETDKIGQCSARNKGIAKATSNFIWFLDDDMKEIPSNYLKKHLDTIYLSDADISCGIPDEIGTNYIDRTIPKIEISNGFPTNDVLVYRNLLLKVGGFDKKMDQLQSEDQEIGLRCVKEGALSVKNNQLKIIHLRANRGGLRKHNVRKVTFASSRNSLFQRRFLHYSEIYLSKKHFTKKAVQKLILLNIRGTFIVRGNILKKMFKTLISFVLLPQTIYILRKRIILARKMLNH